MKRTGIALALFLSLLMVHAQAQCQNSHHSNASSSAQKSSGKTIIDLALGSQNLSTLVAAVKAAGLVETLSGKGPFTVFAPTNTAFSALPAGTVEHLLRPENKAQLVQILTYHVIPGRVEASDLSDGKVTSVEGSKIQISLNGSVVKINDALVTSADNRASNGVVHVIDRVILPPQN
ncbi:MAG: fasciclin domain-containing protein [Bacteroidetes bacterium]|nr:MAG: fasciclin domain-containing protein [Bacteroidota bacterium]